MYEHTRMKKPPTSTPDKTTWIIIGVCVLVAVAVIAYILLKPKDEAQLTPSVLTKTTPPPVSPPPPSLPQLAPVSPPPPSLPPLSPPGLGLTGSPAPASLGSLPVFGPPVPAPVFGPPVPAPVFDSSAPSPVQAPVPAPQPDGFQPGSADTPVPAPFDSPAPSPIFGTPAPAPVFGSPAPSPIFGAPAPAPVFGSPAPTHSLHCPADVTVTDNYGLYSTCCGLAAGHYYIGSEDNYTDWDEKMNRGYTHIRIVNEDRTIQMDSIVLTRGNNFNILKLPSSYTPSSVIDSSDVAHFNNITFICKSPPGPRIVSNLLSPAGFFLRIGSNFATFNSSDNRMVLGSTGNRFRYLPANEAVAEWVSGEWVVEVLGITSGSPRRFLRHMNNNIWAHTVSQISVEGIGGKADFWWSPPVVKHTNADMVVIHQGDHSIGIDNRNFLILVLNQLVPWSTDSTVPPAPQGVCPGTSGEVGNSVYKVDIDPPGLSGVYLSSDDAWAIWNNWAACGPNMKIRLENNNDTFSMNQFTDARGSDLFIYKRFPSRPQTGEDANDNNKVQFGTF